MTRTEIVAIIHRFINEIRDNKGMPPISVHDGTGLLGEDAGLDSLDLAGLVVELQSATDSDPFQQGFLNFNTAGELAELFVGAQR
jgi:acyl carrier protein